MKQDYIQVGDVQFEKLKSTVIDFANSMKIGKTIIYQHKHKPDFILTFPDGISNESFIFFYCGLLAPDSVGSGDILGWFYGNDDMTMEKDKGDFSIFSSKSYSKRIMIIPQGDEEGNLHQYGITETGKEIHFGMDGTYKIAGKCRHPYIQPVSEFKDYEQMLVVETEKGLLDKIKGIFRF